MNSAQSFIENADKKTNGQRHYKTSTMVNAVAKRPIYRSYWRIGTAFAPAFCLRVTYHF